jgi:hypothetical protein
MIPKTKTDARKLAEEYLSKKQTCPPTPLTILDGHTIEADFGWVFFWTSKQYIETGELRYALAGNGPLIVDRRDGSVHETSAAEPLEKVTERYRETHALAS